MASINYNPKIDSLPATTLLEGATGQFLDYMYPNNIRIEGQYSEFKFAYIVPNNFDGSNIVQKTWVKIYQGMCVPALHFKGKHKEFSFSSALPQQPILEWENYSASVIGEPLMHYKEIHRCLTPGIIMPKVLLFWNLENGSAAIASPLQILQHRIKLKAKEDWERSLYQR